MISNAGVAGIDPAACFAHTCTEQLRYGKPLDAKTIRALRSRP